MQHSNPTLIQVQFIGYGATDGAYYIQRRNSWEVMTLDGK
jgi:hypothetical protein